MNTYTLPECPDYANIEDFEKLFEWWEYDFLLWGYTVYWDSLEVINVVDEIRSIVLKLLIDKRANSELSEPFLKLHKRARFLAFWVERFFNNPSLNPDEDYESVKPLCVICDDNNHIQSVNKAYIEATWIDQLSDLELVNLAWESYWRQRDYLNIIKLLSTEKVDHPVFWKVSKLYALIYDDENLAKVQKNLWSLHITQYYRALFRMKITWRLFLWSTIKNDSIKWNIRSAIDVETENHPLLKRLEEESRLKNVDNAYMPYGFMKNITEYKYMIDKILLQWDVDFKLNELFRKVSEFSIIGEQLINRSFFLIRSYDWENHYFNKEFSRNTDFNPTDLLKIMRDGTFMERVYWVPWKPNSAQVADIYKFMASLIERKSYNYIFSPHKNWKSLMIDYVTSRYDDSSSMPPNISDRVRFDELKNKFFYVANDKDGKEVPYVMKTFWIWRQDVSEEDLLSSLKI